MLWARIAADLTVVLHASYVAFVALGMAAIVAGLWLGRDWARNFWFRVLHLAAIAVVAAEALIGVTCPLTRLESYLRRLAGQDSHPGAFIGYWAHRLVFFDAPAWVFTSVYCLLGLAVLATFALAPPRGPGRRPELEPGAVIAPGARPPYLGD